jgi:hypothetical protein
MARVMVIADSRPIAQALVNRLSKSPVVEACQLAPPCNGSYALLFAEQTINTVVYAPQLQSLHRMISHLAEAAAVLAECARTGIAKDDFGMDTSYITAWRRRLFTFLHDYYWRIEVKGVEHIPRQGRAILAGMHRSLKLYSCHKADMFFSRDQRSFHTHQKSKENSLFSSSMRNTVCYSPIAACMNGSSYRVGMNGWTSPRRIFTGSKTSLYSLLPRSSHSPNSKSSKVSVIDVERSSTSLRFSSSYCYCLPLVSVSL